jgi:branched-chain amino acid transport system substrate-binding protein
MNVSKRKASAVVAAVASVALAAGTALPAHAADTELNIGALVPLTGGLSSIVDPELAGLYLARDEINAAGGVLGKKITLDILDEGDGDTPSIVQASATKLLSGGADVIIGAASSGQTKLVLNQIAAKKVVQISGTNTGIALTNWDDNGYYYRTVPSDALQGKVLANQMLKNGKKNVAILFQDTVYGVGLNSTIAKTLKAGGATVFSQSFPQNETSVGSYVDKALAKKPDAVVIVSYDEAKKIIPALKAKKFVGKNIYLVDGNAQNYSKESFASYLAGAYGTVPGKALSTDFKNRLQAAYKAETGKNFVDYIYPDSIYDAVIIAALAAQAAGDADGASIKTELTNITKAGAGKVTVKTYAAGLAALKAGKKINYDGVTGTIEFDKNGDPTGAYIGIYKYSSKGTTSLVRTVLGSAK